MTQLVPQTVCYVAIGFSSWKKSAVRLCFAPQQVRFVDQPDQVPAGAVVVVWGRKEWPQFAGRQPMIRLEDGFIRSVGLGADLIKPLSWVVDSRGLYYDPTQVSDLEHLLATHEFPADLCRRAAQFRQQLVSAKLTKYNVGGQTWSRPAGKSRIVLVAGQVESDAAIHFGSPVCKSNLALLQKARELEPDAWLVYKPHPDVVARLRAAGTDEATAATVADEVITDVDMADLLTQVDAVHVMSSLTGFEALLRHVEVICHGMPFYAGWGLTNDLLPIPRRSRRLTLDQLVAASLLLYPRYFNKANTQLLTPEQALGELVSWRQQQSVLMRPYFWLKRLIVRAVVGIK